MTYVRIAIIGAGPRGLAVLERLSAILGRRDDVQVDIRVVDPGVPGQGIHRDSQPDHLLTNTAAGSTTVFVDDSVQGAGPPRPGPSLCQWLQLAGYRHSEGRLALSKDGDLVQRGAFVPRAILGRYLSWCFREIVARMPSSATVRHHASRATGVARRRDGRFDIDMSDDTRLDVDFLFLTTGHSGSASTEAESSLEARVAPLRRRNPRLAYLRTLDDIERLDAIDPDARVAICGTGLTAIDAISMLTYGRGGRFTKVGEQRLRYHPSGREPRITLFSRQGLPPTSRAIDQKVRSYTPRFFTTAFVDALRRRKGKLDWMTDLLPTFEKEMAFRLSCADGIEPDPSSYEPSRGEAQAVDAFLRPWKHATIADPDAHAAFLRRHLETDIAASFVGNVDDPFKAIVEMIRDLNDVVRRAVDYGGLTSTSHATFLHDWCSINNRIAAGPPKERNMELLALIDAGIVDFFEPDPKIELADDTASFEIVSNAFGYTHRDRFDVLIQARVGVLRPHASTDPLLRSGLAKGVFRAFDNDGFPPSGIAIDANLNVVDAQGRPIPNFWAMGYVVEGAHYYTYVLPCPSANTRSLRDAGKAVLAMMDQLPTTIRREPPAQTPEFERLES